MRLTHKLDPLSLYRRQRLNALLLETAKEAARCETAEAVYALMDRCLADLVPHDRLALRLFDRQNRTVTDTFTSGDPIPEWMQGIPRPVAGTATEAVMASGRPLILADVRKNDLIARFPGLMACADELPSMVTVPIIYHGRAIGLVQMRARKIGAFTEEKAEIVRTVSSFIAPLVVNAMQLEQLQREVSERAVLAEIGRIASGTIDFGEVWQQFAEIVKTLLPCDRMVLALLNEDSTVITDRHVYGLPVPDWDWQPERKLSIVPADSIIRTRESRISTAEENDKALFNLLGFNFSERTGLRSLMSTPVIAGDRVIGSINIRSKRGNAYTKQHLATFERMPQQIAGPVAATELYTHNLNLAEERAARVELELRNARLIENDRTRSRFISNLSHELRTPLTSIIAFTDIIRRTKTSTLSERDKNHIEVISRSSQRLKVLIDDMLDLSRIEADNLRLNGSVFTLQESVISITESMRPTLAAKNQRLVSNFSDSDIRMVTDRERLEQILSNLISNASKYSPERSVIRVEGGVQQGRVRVSVIDSGIGIDESDLPLLFNEFSRLDNEATRSTQGVGLGLALSRRLARAMSGDIELTSGKERGSVFTLVLPQDMQLAA
jgi:signal transduction histidine kinase